MSCEKIQYRIDELLRQGRGVEADANVVEHLGSCAKCRRLHAAATELQSICGRAADETERDILPLSIQRQQVVARAARGERVSQSPAPVRLRVVMVAAAVLIVAIAALVPFTYERIMGYNVAFAGVNYECGSDGEMICNMLYDLGLHEADVDLLGCDSTCNLMVMDLKTEREVDMVVAALSALCQARVDTSVIPVVKRGSSTLFDRAHQRINPGG